MTGTLSLIAPRDGEAVERDLALPASGRTRPDRRYRAVVNDSPTPPRPNPVEWAAFIREQLAQRGLEPKSAARPVGPFPAGEATIRRWRDNREQLVSIDKVFEVAAALNYPIWRLLVRIGLVPPEQVGVVGLAPDQPTMPPIVRRIDGLLTNRRVPEPARDWLVGLLEATVTYWARSLGAPAPADGLASGSKRKVRR